MGLPLDKRVATDIPFVFDFSLAENESRCIAASEIEIASESSCGQTQLRNGMLQGGSASNLLAALTSGVFWDSGSHRETYVVFRFARSIILLPLGISTEFSHFLAPSPCPVSNMILLTSSMYIILNLAFFSLPTKIREINGGKSLEFNPSCLAICQSHRRHFEQRGSFGNGR